MKNQKGLGLIGVLLILGALLLTIGGVVGLPAVRQVWEKKDSPAPIPISTVEVSSTPAAKPSISPPHSPSPQGALKLVIVGVKIDPPFQPEGNLTPEEMDKQRVAITETVDKVISGLDATQVYARWDSIPYFGIKADSKTLEYLSNHPLVISIKEDKPVPPLFQGSE